MDEEKDPERRVRLARAAVVELPDSPRVLQRVAQEELLAMTRSGDPDRERGFQEAYLELRTRAPGMADELKRSVAERLRPSAAAAGVE